jgi:hypothetical protein
VKTGRTSVLRHVRLAAVLAAVILGLGCNSLLSGGQQTWLLDFGGGSEHEYVTVTVPSGVTGSVFDQKGSQGLVFYDDLSNPIKITVGGQISGANWDFVNMTGSSTGASIVCGGGGSMDKAYPDGDSVSGSMTVNFVYHPSGHVENYSIPFIGVRTQ